MCLLFPYNTRGGCLQIQNYLLEGGPLVAGFPQGECSRNPSVSAYQLVLWEAALSFSEFCLKTLSRHLLDSGWWFTSTPAYTMLSVQQFLTKNSRTPGPHPPYSPYPALSDFIFVSLDKKKKSPQRETFCHCATGETKNSRITKRHQNWWVQNCFAQWKKILIGVLHQMESTWKVTEVLTCKNKYTIFINKFHFGVIPLHIFGIKEWNISLNHFSLKNWVF